jgi:two-component system response regulator AtoC
MGKPLILIADDEEGVRELFSEICVDEGYDVILASNGLEAVEKARIELPDVIILDMRMPEIDGMEAFRRIKDSLINVPVLFITAYGSPDLAIEAMKEGAYNYITKPFDIDEIRILIRKATQLRELTKKATTIRKNIPDSGDEEELIGQSNIMQEIYKLIGKVSEINAPVLIQGEGGSGKELIAKKIHSSSKLKDKPFTVINCYSDDNQFSSELNNIGKNPQTYFIKNIELLSLSSQLRLSEAIKNSKDSRFISGTTINLLELVSKKLFREDLYYALNIVFMSVPPLRQRKEDIEEISLYFMKRQGIKYGKILNGFTAEALMLIKEYDWPGNLDELENAITHSIIVATGNLITPEDLPESILSINKSLAPDNKKINSSNMTLSEAVKQFEREIILKTLISTNWNKTKTAEILGISRRSLFNKMRDLKLLKDENNEP